MNDTISRRPIQARDTRWAASTARWLSRVGFRPNPISLLSILFGALAGASFAAVGIVETVELKCGCLVLAAVGIQLRLLCNLFDGMVAVEGGFRTKSGELFNELPDRFSDAFIIVGCGYSFAEPSWLRELAWTAAVLAIIAAYVRTLGALLMLLEIPGYIGENGKLLFFFVLICELSDVLQYVFGKTLGRHAVAPSVSPGKTWEGFVGGVLATVVVGSALWWATPFNPWQAAGLSLAIALMGFGGGLVMSAIKRDRGVKDWGQAIEGHGGVLDRIDSLCFADPCFFT